MSNTNSCPPQRLFWSSVFVSKAKAAVVQYREDEKTLLPQSNRPEGFETSSDPALERIATKRAHVHHFILIQLGLLIIYTLLTVTITRFVVNSNCPSPLLFSPASSVDRVEAKLLHAHLFEENPFKGKPSPSLEAAWDNLFQNSYIRLSPQELKRLGRSSTLIQDGSGDFLGALDMYHQLHCVKYIYEAFHPEYYQLNDTNISVPDHVDHCIDMLRQVTMCRADTAVMTFSYFPDNPIAWPDFNMQHECHSWDAVNEWAGKKGRAVDQSDSKHLKALMRNPDYGEKRLFQNFQSRAVADFDGYLNSGRHVRRTRQALNAAPHVPRRVLHGFT